MKALPADPIAYIGETSTKEEDDSSAEVVTKAIVERPSEGFGTTPLEDRNGRDLWVRTRMCFCPKESPTDCRFHPPTEKGWEQCPHLNGAKNDTSILGRWLWARNPLYGKPLTDEELAARNPAPQAIAA